MTHTGSLDSAFIPYHPRKMACGEKQSFFFVTYTGDPVSKNKAARKTIRAQASRASASQRIETTAMRRGNQRCQSTSPSKKSRFSNTKTKQSPPNEERLQAPTTRSMLFNQAANIVPSGSQLTSMMPYTINLHTSSIADLDLDIDDWEFGIVNIIREHYVKAVLEIRRQQKTCDMRVLSMLFTCNRLYCDPLVLQVLELLSISSANLPGVRPGMSRPIVVWLWHRINATINAIHQSRRSNSTWSLAPTLALLAGWELKHGMTRHCEDRLSYLECILSGDCQPNCSISLPLEASTSCIPQREFQKPFPPGFEFYQMQNLLPSCLMNVVGALSLHDPYLPEASIEIRRIGVAAITCQPCSPTAIQAVKLNEIDARIVIHVRLAAAMFNIMAQLDSEHPNIDLMHDPMAGWYPETLVLDSETLVGTVYDEILLWSLCIFCCAALHQPTPPIQKTVVESLLMSMNLETWGMLGNVLSKYAWTTNLASRLASTLPELLGSIP